MDKRPVPTMSIVQRFHCTGLGDCSQYVYVSYVASSTLPVISGVHRGSIIGPLLFLVFINELRLAVPSSHLHRAVASMRQRRQLPPLIWCARRLLYIGRQRMLPFWEQYTSTLLTEQEHLLSKELESFVFYSQFEIIVAAECTCCTQIVRVRALAPAGMC